MIKNQSIKNQTIKGQTSAAVAGAMPGWAR
jgi:hypothetical protein